MPYIWVNDSQDKTKTISEALLSDGKRFYKTMGIASRSYKELTKELNKFEIDPEKFLLMINPLFYLHGYSFESLVCQTILTKKDGSEIYQHKTKIRTPYPSPLYHQSSMYKGSKVYRFGQVFVFDNIESLADVIKINIRWFIQDDVVIVAETEIFPEFVYPEVRIEQDGNAKLKDHLVSEEQPHWYYIKNIDAFPEDMSKHMFPWKFPVYKQIENNGASLSEAGEMWFKQTLYPQLFPDNGFFMH